MSNKKYKCENDSASTALKKKSIFRHLNFYVPGDLAVIDFHVQGVKFHVLSR